MEIEMAQVDNLSIAIEEIKRVAQIEGVMNLLVVATNHRPGEPQAPCAHGMSGCSSARKVFPKNPVRVDVL